MKNKSIKSAYDLAAEVKHWVNDVGVLDEVPEYERDDSMACADHVAAKIQDPSEFGYSDETPEDSMHFVEAIAKILEADDYALMSSLRQSKNNSSKKRRPKTADERAKDEGADITCSRKVIKSSTTNEELQNDYEYFTEDEATGIKIFLWKKSFEQMKRFFEKWNTKLTISDIIEKAIEDNPGNEYMANLYISSISFSFTVDIVCTDSNDNIIDEMIVGLGKVQPLESSRKPIKSGMSYQQALDEFTANGKPWGDYYEMQVDWTAFVDSLERDGLVDYEEARWWDNPCTPKEFNEWVGRTSDDTYDDYYDNGIWDEEEIRDMGEMYGVPRGATSEEALKFFESRQRKTNKKSIKSEFEIGDEVVVNDESKDLNEIEGTVTDIVDDKAEVVFKSGEDSWVDLDKIESAKKPVKSAMPGREKSIRAIMDEYGCSWEEAEEIMNDEIDSGCYSKSKKGEIKSSPDFKKYTADDIFDEFNISELTDTVFMDREQCKANKCGMDEFTDLMWDIVPTWLGVRTPDDVREVCNKAKNPKAKSFLRAFETALDNAKFTDKFYDSVKIHKKGEIKSSLRKEDMNLYLQYRDDLFHAINEVDKKYNMSGRGPLATKEDFDSVIEWMDVHDYWNDDVD